MMSETAATALERWHREEPRDVRPFFLAVSAADALNDCTIRITDDGEPSKETDFNLSEIDFQNISVTLFPSVANPSSWLPAGYDASDFVLLLLLRHPILKRSEIIESASLSAPIPAEWPVSPESMEGFGGGRNVELTLAICLADDRKALPGAPFVQGHWLARKVFVLRSPTTPSLFDIRTRTDEEWTQAGYPPKTFYAVEYNGGIELEPEDGGSVATVWMHADAHSKLATSGIGDSVQNMLAAEIVFTVLSDSSRDWSGLDNVSDKSPLATLLKRLGSEKALSIDDLKSLWKSPAKFKGFLQDRLSVVASVR